MATSPSATPTPITPPRVPIIDPRTGLIDRAWYQFFLSLFRASTTALDDQNFGPPVQDLSGDFSNLYDQAQLASMSNSLVESLQTQIDGVRQEVQTLPKPPLGTMAPLQQDNLPWVRFDTTAENVPVVAGAVAWDGGTTLGVQATPNVLIRVGESERVGCDYCCAYAHRADRP